METPATQPDSKRRDTRLPFEVEVEIRTPEHTVRATARDISLSGLFVQSAELFPMDTICEVEVIQSSDEGDLSLDGRAHVVRQVEDPETGVRGMGLRFVGLNGD